jgi:hypothetical protein
MNLNFGYEGLSIGVIYKHYSIKHMWIHLRKYTSCARNKKLSFVRAGMYLSGTALT